VDFDGDDARGDDLHGVSDGAGIGIQQMVIGNGNRTWDHVYQL
jgi:hypothetical protein